MNQNLLKLMMVFSILLFNLTSCTKDEETTDNDSCTLSDWETNIVGTWQVDLFIDNELDSSAEVVFNSNGSFDDNEFLLSQSTNGVVDVLTKEWSSIPGDSIHLHAFGDTADGGTADLTLNLKVIPNSCDQINLDLNTYLFVPTYLKYEMTK